MFTLYIIYTLLNITVPLVYYLWLYKVLYIVFLIWMLGYFWAGHNPWIQLCLEYKSIVHKINLHMRQYRCRIFKNTQTQYLWEIHNFDMCIWTSDWNWKKRQIWSYHFILFMICFSDKFIVISHSEPLLSIIVGGYKLILKLFFSFFGGHIISSYPLPATSPLTKNQRELT